MSRLQSLEQLVGRWTGTSCLWRPWLPSPESESASAAVVALAARGKFITIAYTWDLDGEEQEGFILLGREAKGSAVHASWVDSWHMSDKPMTCVGGMDDAGALAVLGSYAAPPGPDWGWRTVIARTGENSFEIVMYNVTPDGQETIAVRSRYERQT